MTTLPRAFASEQHATADALGDDLARLAERLRQGPFVALTGAGLSTASGIPAYRDEDGQWRHSQPIQHQAFLQSEATRRRYWARSFIGWRNVARAQPNEGHLALAALERAGHLSGVITQNVDGLHLAAGSTALIELHGALRVVRCLGCGRHFERAEVQQWMAQANPCFDAQPGMQAPDGDVHLADEAHADFVAPACTACAGVLKPDVVFFGDNVPRERVAEAARMVADAAGLLVVGSSLMVYSGYRFVEQAHRLGRPVLAINRGRTRADALLSAKIERDCGDALSALRARLELTDLGAAARAPRARHARDMPVLTAASPGDTMAAPPRAQPRQETGMPFTALQPHRLERIIQMQSLIVQAEFDLDGFMQLVVDNLQELTDARGAVVELVQDDVMVYRAASGSMWPHIGMRLARDGSLSGLCVRTNEVLRCIDVETDARVDLAACRRVGVRSMVCTPLLESGVPIGVLKVMSERVDAFGEEDVQTLRLMADVLGAALGKQVAFDRLLRAEEQLRASEAFLDRTGRAARVGGWELDPATGRLSWSEQTRRLHEVPPDWIPTVDKALAFYAEEGRPLIRQAVEQALLDDRPWDLELPLVTATGRCIWVRTWGETEREDGPEGRRVIRLTGAIQDVTEHRLRKEELRREQDLRNQLERHARETRALLTERSEMLNVLAHEVRQPLNNASAALQSAAKVLNDIREANASERLSRARAVMGQVLANIDNTLAVASLLTRSEQADRVDADIDTLIAVAVADMAEDQRERIVVQRESRTRTASMDMSLMRLALRNLLSNALKLSPPGAPVTIRLSDSDAPLALLIDVIDNGPGIPDATVPTLFERSPRSASGTQHGGHTLGLYIVRRVMEMHGGEVSLKATGPRGTTMRLTMALAPAD